MLNGNAIPLDFSRQGALDRLEFLAWFTDSAIRIPGTSRTFGADSLLSLIPGIGSLMGTSLSLYVIAEAIRHGAPARVLARMAANIGIDTLIGAIPVLGFFFDFGAFDTPDTLGGVFFIGGVLQERMRLRALVGVMRLPYSGEARRSAMAER